MIDCIFCISRVIVHCTGFFIVSSYKWVLYSIKHVSDIVLIPRSTLSVFKERLEVLSGRVKGDAQ